MKRLVSINAKPKAQDSMDPISTPHIKSKDLSEDKEVEMPGKLKRIGLGLVDICIDLIEFFLASI